MTLDQLQGVSLPSSNPPIFLGFLSFLLGRGPLGKLEPSILGQVLGHPKVEPLPAGQRFSRWRSLLVLLLPLGCWARWLFFSQKILDLAWAHHTGNKVMSKEFRLWIPSYKGRDSRIPRKIHWANYRVFKTTSVCLAKRPNSPSELSSPSSTLPWENHGKPLSRNRQGTKDQTHGSNSRSPARAERMSVLFIR